MQLNKYVLRKEDIRVVAGESVFYLCLFGGNYPNQSDPWNGTSDQWAFSFAFPAI